MKDYSLGNNEEFIEGFKVKQEKLYVKITGRRKKWILDDTMANREMLLSRMEKQVKNNHKKALKKKVEFLKETSGLTKILLITMLGILLTSVAVIIAPMSIITSVLGTIGVAGMLVSEIIKSKRYKRMMDELERDKHFIKHQDEFNQGIKNTKEKENIVTNLKAKNQTKVLNIANSQSYTLSLNDISTFSLKELYCLRDNIEQDQSFQQELEKTEEKGNQKIKQ